ncbi:YueI family protein [Marinisporobacter balticus]|uniref:Uncharacterized protein YueI n=1 Tax=Marinisporobacter balticus TaxID=2018667 RepID=A0A4R2KXQ1_9FIRM|nr:YueI family protein [Marinisporobacter balticus]TCO78804.1 uncharacterized protein YueI [Marinisporobacter balticus]
MNQKSELEKYTEYGLSGSPQIKADEKRYWLGEFRERVIFALTYEQINRKEAVKIVEEKCKDHSVKKIIIEQDVQDVIAEKFMDVANKYQKDYKMIDTQNKKGEIALVLVSNEAVDEKEIVMDEIPMLPEAFYHSKNKKLCKKHMEILQEKAHFFIDEFEEITLLDKMMGIKCGVCEHMKES